MKNLFIALTLLFFLAGFQTAALAAPDTYIGDAAIYSALDTGSTRPKPHVLLLIDTSRATLNIASGVKYDPTIAYTGDKARYSVYAASNQGDFNTLTVASSTAALEGITGGTSCTTAVKDKIITTLSTSGTYSGSGSSDSPNLKNGLCDLAPMGGTYALGNYLNYLATNVPGTNVVKKIYDCTITRKSGAPPRAASVPNGCIGTFQFTGTVDHTTDTSTEPIVGADWQDVWTQTSGGCIAGVHTNCSSTSDPPQLAVATEIPTWALGLLFHPGSFAGGTQREIIYNALSQVVDGARGAVKFGAMTYNETIQGGDVAYGMSDLSNDTTFGLFKAELPGQTSDGTLTGAALINAGPARPQAEALFDAGYYLGARYPTSGTIASDAVFPLPGITARENISSTMAGTYDEDNRNECGYNHIILITNGLSNTDNNPDLEHIVDADGDGRSSDDEKTYGLGSHYLDDVAAYLYKQEGIVTHTVLAFQTSDPLIEGAAYSGGGKFYNVYDANSLAEALTKLLATIVLEADTSFVAPVVPASSTNRTISSNRVYLGLFKPQSNRPWLGNLKKYGVSSDLTLLDRSNNAATDLYGDFLPNSKSYWGDDGSSDRKIVSIDGLLPLTTGSVSGDGGNVAAGGVGGTLKFDLQAGLLASPKRLAWESRKIYTYPSGSASTTLTHADNRFSPNTSNAKMTKEIFAVDTDSEMNELINYVAGADGYDDDNNGEDEEIRDWILGDVLHSKPLIFSYGSYTEAQETNCTYNKSMIYVGSNDGMFHAFNDCDGKEAWAFIPDNVLPNLKYLRESDHLYFADGAPTAYVHDVNNNNIIETGQGDKVVLIFGQGRGGGRSTLHPTDPRGAYYALDVSNPAVPVLLWKVDSTTTGFGELGETWSPPRLAKVKVGSDVKVVAFVGAGYDNNEDLRFGKRVLFPVVAADFNTTTPISNSGPVDSPAGSLTRTNPRGRGIFAIEVAELVKADAAAPYQPNFDTDGSLVWSFVKANDNGQGMDYSIPSDLTVLDMDGNGFQDRIYVGDTGGRLWRFDVGSTAVTDWTSSGRIIFNSDKVGGETNSGRKIFYRPTVALLHGTPTLYFGTGDRNHPLNTAVIDRLFAVKDRGQLTANYIDIDNLADLTDNELQNSSDATVIQGVLNSLATTDANVAGYYGWYVDLDQNVGEKVLASALVFNKQVFYTTYQSTPTASLDACQIGNLGVSRLYQLDYATAEATQNYSGGNDSLDISANLRAKGGDGIVLQREDRVRTIGVGIPSGIVTLIDASGKVTLLISSSNRVGTYQAPDARLISPLYWIKY